MVLCTSRTRSALSRTAFASAGRRAGRRWRFDVGFVEPMSIGTLARGWHGRVTCSNNMKVGVSKLDQIGADCSRHRSLHDSPLRHRNINKATLQTCKTLTAKTKSASLSKSQTPHWPICGRRDICNKRHLINPLYEGGPFRSALLLLHGVQRTACTSQQPPDQTSCISLVSWSGLELLIRARTRRRSMACKSDQTTQSKTRAWHGVEYQLAGEDLF